MSKTVKAIRMSTPQELRLSIERVLDQLELCGIAISSDVNAVRLLSRFIPDFYFRDERIFITRTTRKLAKNLIIVHPDYNFIRKNTFSFQILPNRDRKIKQLENISGKYKKKCLFCNGEFFTNKRNKRFCSDYCSIKYTQISNKDEHLKKISNHCNLEDVYKRYRYSAKERGYTFELTFKDFSKLVKEKCYYCGGKEGRYNGIDRKRNNIGYTKNNSVSCCSLCNRMKWDMELDDFAYAIINLKEWAEEHISDRRKEEEKVEKTKIKREFGIFI